MSEIQGAILTLADLSRDAWTTVATSYQPARWTWLLSSHDAAALYLGRDAGAILTVQVRQPDGGFELRARLVGRGGR